MFRTKVIFSIVLAGSAGLSQHAFSQDDIDAKLSRAEALYFEAKFNESIQLLAPVNDTLRTQPDRVKQRISAKFQLALANIGLNNTAAAKSFLMEIYSLDPAFVVEAQQFSPKVVALASDARTEQNNVRCKSAVMEAQENLAVADASALLSLLQSMKPKCAALAAIEPDAAELVFRKGLSDYRQGDLPAALQSFRAALNIVPKHEMAAQYLELTESKLQVAGDRVLLDWQREFQAHQFKDAAAVYRRIASFDDASNAQTLSRMGSEYRKALAPLVESWNLACSSGDDARLSEIRDEISELLPEPSFGADVRSKMVPCAPVTAPPPVSIAAVPIPAETKPAAEPEDEKKVAAPSPTGCFQMDASLALVRLKQRVDPTFTTQALAYLQNSQASVVVKVRIEGDGSVTVIDATGANVLVTNAVRSSMAAWKFTPAMGENGPRCVDTEIPIVISRR